MTFKQAQINQQAALALGLLGGQVLGGGGSPGVISGGMNPPTYMPGGGFGGGVRDIGLAQLSSVNPEAANLAAARLEAEANVNAMSPFEGMGAGAAIGAPLGGLLGAGLGYGALAAQSPAAGLVGAVGGGLLGALGGGLTGGRISRGLEMETRRAKAYQSALSRLGASRAAL